MIQLLPDSNLLTPNTTDPNKAIEYINTYIDKYHCKTMDIDISFMNTLDACFVSTMCSTKHYIKYPDGKINWKISSKLTEDFTNCLNLGNCEYSV